MAELRTFASQAHIGGSHSTWEPHRQILKITVMLCASEKMDRAHLNGLRDLMLVMADRIEDWVHLPVMRFTHLQPAEPTTLGYRLASCHPGSFLRMGTPTRH